MGANSIEGKSITSNKSSLFQFPHPKLPFAFGDSRLDILIAIASRDLQRLENLFRSNTSLMKTEIQRSTISLFAEVLNEFKDRPIHLAFKLCDTTQIETTAPSAPSRHHVIALLANNFEKILQMAKEHQQPPPDLMDILLFANALDDPHAVTIFLENLPEGPIKTKGLDLQNQIDLNRKTLNNFSAESAEDHTAAVPAKPYTMGNS